MKRWLSSGAESCPIQVLLRVDRWEGDREDDVTSLHRYRFKEQYGQQRGSLAQSTLWRRVLVLRIQVTTTHKRPLVFCSFLVILSGSQFTSSVPQCRALHRAGYCPI